MTRRYCAPSPRASTRSAFGSVAQRCSDWLDRSRYWIEEALRTTDADQSVCDTAVLEERLLFSATPLVQAITESGADSGATSPLSFGPEAPTTATPTATGTSPTANEGTSTNSARRELVVVDASTANYQQLLDDLATQSDIAREVLLLDGDQDGIAQISAYLKGVDDLNAIHLISHGSEGQIKLGNTWLNQDNLTAFSSELSLWSDSLAEQADLLVYGCDLAASEAGRELLESLGVLTGADIAASDDTTGHAQFHGDWELEFTIGEIETSIAVSESFQQNWHGKLAVISVTTTNDLVDGDTSSVADLLADRGADGLISLREAIIAVNAGPGGDTIQLDAGTYSLTLGGAGEDAAETGDLDIEQTMTILGAGAETTIIDASLLTGGDSDRVFHIKNGSSVSLTGLTISGGSKGEGAGILIEGSSEVTIQQTRIINNQSDDADGAGVHIVDGIVTMTDVMIAGNDAGTGDGGGILNQGNLTLDRVTISGNSANNGGGIRSHTSGSRLLMTNTTLSGNIATGQGGGLDTDGEVLITNSTIAFNRAASGGGIAASGEDVEIRNSILASNTSLDGSVSENLSGEIDSLGYNIDSDGTAGLGSEGDQSNVDPLLGALADQGGFVQTHAPAIGSPATNAGSFVSAPNVDARGYSSADGRWDVGAHQTGAVQADKVYWTITGSDGKIQSADLDGSNVRDVLTGLSDPDELFIDATNGKIYWSESSNGVIRRANLNGTDQENVLTGLISPQAFAIDFETQKIYWAEDGLFTNRIRRADLDGSNFETLLSFDLVSSPDHLTLDLENGKIYWSDELTRKIERADLDGTNVETLVTASQSPQSVAIDLRAEKLYWMERDASGTNDSLMRADLDGSNPVSLISSGMSLPDNLILNHPLQQVYWTDPGSNAIFRASLDGSNPEVLQLDSSSQPKGIAFGTAAPNSLPTADAGGPYTISPGDTLHLDGSGSSDPDGDSLTFAWDLDNDGIFGEPGEPTTETASIAWSDLRQMGFDNNSSQTIGLRVDDGQSGVSISTTVGVTNAPISITSPSTISVVENESFVLNVTVDDPTNSATFQVTGGSDGGLFTINTNSGALAFAVAPDFEAATDLDGDNVYEVEVTATNNRGILDTQLIQVTVTDLNESPISGLGDDNPTADGVDENAAIGSIVGITVTAVDPDGSDSVTYSLSSNPADRFQIDPSTGVVLTNAVFDAETNTSHSITVLATSTDGTSTTADFTIAVRPLNDNAPVFTSLSTHRIDENQTIVHTLTATDADLPAQNISFSVTGGADQSRFSINASNELIFVAAPDFESPADHNGDNRYEVEVTADDGAGETTVQSIQVRVRVINERPTLTPIADQTIDEDTPSRRLDFSISDPETPGSDLSVTATSSNANVVSDTNILFSGEGANRSLVVNPLLNQHGTTTITVAVSDGTHTTSTSFVVTINPVNDAPVANQDEYDLLEGESRSWNAAEGILANDFDLEGDALTAALVQGPAHAEVFQLRPDGSFTYHHDGSETLLDTFVYSTTDGELVSTATVTIRIEPQNDAPVLEAISDQVINEDQPFGPLTIIISDADHSTSNLTLDATSANPLLVSNSSIVWGGSDHHRTLRLQPNADATGTTLITVRLSDGETEVTETFQIQVNPVNDAPIAVADQLALDGNGTVVFRATNLMRNDIEQDGDFLTLQIVDPPTKGTLIDLGNGRFRYEADPDQIGTASFTYRLFDGVLFSEATTVQLTPITPVPIQAATTIPAPAALEVEQPANSESETSADAASDENPDAEASSDTNAATPADAALNLNHSDPSLSPSAATTSATTSNPAGGIVPPANVALPRFENHQSDGEEVSAETDEPHMDNSTARETERAMREAAAASTMVRVQGMVNEPHLWQAINSMQGELQQSSEPATITIGATVTATTGITVGYVIWVIRGGILLSSVVANLPMWRLMDPMAILNSADHGPEDDESLESMVDDTDPSAPNRVEAGA